MKRCSVYACFGVHGALCETNLLSTANFHPTHIMGKHPIGNTVSPSHTLASSVGILWNVQSPSKSQPVQNLQFYLAVELLVVHALVRKACPILDLSLALARHDVEQVITVGLHRIILHGHTFRFTSEIDMGSPHPKHVRILGYARSLLDDRCWQRLRAGVPVAPSDATQKLLGPVRPFDADHLAELFPRAAWQIFRSVFTQDRGIPRHASDNEPKRKQKARRSLSPKPTTMQCTCTVQNQRC